MMRAEKKRIMRNSWSGWRDKKTPGNPGVANGLMILIQEVLCMEHKYNKIKNIFCQVLTLISNCVII